MNINSQNSIDPNLDDYCEEKNENSTDGVIGVDKFLLNLHETIEQRLNEHRTQDDSNFTSVQTLLLKLQETVKQRLTYDETKEEAFNYLYSELKALKENSTFESIKSVYIDLILLFDRIQTLCNRIEDSEATSISTSEVLDKFGSIRDELLEVLYRREIVKIQTDWDAPFNPNQQRAVSIQPTDNEADNNMIESIVREGFNYRGHLLRSEEVVVYKMNKRS
jgi:molecular chaperone GrpE